MGEKKANGCLRLPNSGETIVHITNKLKMDVKLCSFIIAITLTVFLGCSYPDATIIFFDSFNADTQGACIENVIHLPPPDGFGYIWDVLPGDKTQ